MLNKIDGLAPPASNQNYLHWRQSKLLVIFLINRFLFFL